MLVFFLHEHGDPHFLFYKFNENNILNNWEKNLAEICGYFFAKWNPLKDKNVN